LSNTNESGTILILQKKFGTKQALANFLAEQATSSPFFIFLRNSPFFIITFYILLLLVKQKKNENVFYKNNILLIKKIFINFTTHYSSKWLQFGGCMCKSTILDFG